MEQQAVVNGHNPAAAPKRRGRKPGSKNKPKAQAAQAKPPSQEQMASAAENLRLARERRDHVQARSQQSTSAGAAVVNAYQILAWGEENLPSEEKKSELARAVAKLLLLIVK